MFITAIFWGLLVTPKLASCVIYRDKDIEAIVIADSIATKLDLLLPAIKVTSSSCTTPNGLEGNCRSLTECFLPYKYIPIEISSVEELLHAGKQCRGETSQVCCPSVENVPVKKSETMPILANTGSHLLPGEISECDFTSQNVSEQVSQCSEPTGRPSYVVQLLCNGRHLCSGSLINDRWILTAAHCLHYYFKVAENPAHLKVRLADYNPSGQNSQDWAVKQALYHSGFNESNQDNDISLIELSRPAFFSSKVSPACLSTAEPIYRQNTIRVRFSPPVNRSMSVISKSDCDSIYEAARKNPPVEDLTVCASHTESGDGCDDYDGGAPLMSTSGVGKSLQVGISSWHYGCSYAEVFTKVNQYFHWIQKIVAS